MRTAQLGTDRIHLLGQVPRLGERLTAEFVIPAARLADKPLTADELRSGVVVVSTLPTSRNMPASRKSWISKSVAGSDCRNGRSFMCPRTMRTIGGKWTAFIPIFRPQATPSVARIRTAARRLFWRSGSEWRTTIASLTGCSHCETACFWKLRFRPIK